jgi:hypothetical protein
MAGFELQTAVCIIMQEGFMKDVWQKIEHEKTFEDK